MLLRTEAGVSDMGQPTQQFHSCLCYIEIQDLAGEVVSLSAHKGLKLTITLTENFHEFIP